MGYDVEFVIPDEHVEKETINICKKNGLDISKLRPIDAADKPNPPGLFVHALQDELVPLQHSIDLNKLYNGEKSLVSCKGGHNSARPKMVIDRIMQFLCKYLKGVNIEIEPSTIPPNVVEKIENEEEEFEEYEEEEFENNKEYQFTDDKNS